METLKKDFLSKVLKLEGSDDCYLFVNPDTFNNTTWTISSTLTGEKRFIKSGNAGMACPAHPRNKVSKQMDKVSKQIEDWFTNVGEAGKDKFEPGEVVVQCTVHP